MGRSARARRRAEPRSALVTPSGRLEPLPAPPRPSSTPAERGRVDVLAVLEEIRQKRHVLDRRQGKLVALGRSQGLSWADLGRALGVSGQAVSMRYGRAA